MRHINLFIFLLLGFSWNSIAQPNPPQGEEIQSFCDSATVADLVAIPDPGGTVTWYDAPVGGNVLNSGDNLSQGDLVYASQTLGGVESVDRLQVLVHFINPRIVPANPIVCSGESIELTVEFDMPQINNASYLGFVESKHFYFSNQAETFLIHENIAASYGGNLISIHSQATMDFVINESPGTGYIGLNDLIIENSFEWTDASAVDFTNWYPGEPNNILNEDAVAFYPSGLWVDVSENQMRNALYQFYFPDPTITWSTGASTLSIIQSPNESQSLWVEVSINNVTCRENIIVNVFAQDPLFRKVIKVLVH